MEEPLTCQSLRPKKLGDFASGHTTEGLLWLFINLLVCLYSDYTEAREGEEAAEWQRPGRTDSGRMLLGGGHCKRLEQRDLHKTHVSPRPFSSLLYVFLLNLCLIASAVAYSSYGSSGPCVGPWPEILRCYLRALWFHAFLAETLILGSISAQGAGY